MNNSLTTKILIWVTICFTIVSCQAPSSPEEADGLPLSLSKYYREDLQVVAPTELHRAVLSRDIEAVKLAAQNSYSINLANQKFGETPLQLAMELKEYSISEYLALFPSLDIYHQNHKKEGYLFSASKNGMFRVVQILFERHKRFNNILRTLEHESFDFINSDGQRALHVALNAETAEALRLSGYWSAGRIFDKDGIGQTPLHQAALDKRAMIFQWAAQRYCQDYDEYFRHSVLPNWLDQFLSSGLKLTVEGIRWLSPKVRWDWYKFIAANPFNYPDASGNTPLHLAIISGSLVTVQAALTCDYVDVAQRNLKKLNALHLAAQSANPQILELILSSQLVHTWWTQRSTWMNQLDTAGYSPLHYAAQNISQSQSYHLLVKAGANEQLLSSQGQSPLELFNSTRSLRESNPSKMDQ